MPALPLTVKSTSTVAPPLTVKVAQVTVVATPKRLQEAAPLTAKAVQEVVVDVKFPVTPKSPPTDALLVTVKLLLQEAT